MMGYLLFFCIFVNQTYWPHFGLNILLNFAHDSEVRKAYLPKDTFKKRIRALLFEILD